MKIDNIEMERLLRVSIKKGVLDPFVLKTLIKLVDDLYWVFCSDTLNYMDIKQDCYLRILRYWKSYDYRHGTVLSYFTELIKRSIYLSIKELNGVKQGYDLPKWISLSNIKQVNPNQFGNEW